MSKSCEDFSEELSLYIDGLLNAQEKVELEKHLENCKSCNDRLNELKEIVGAMEGLNVDPPLSLHEKIMETIHAEREKEKKKTEPKALWKIRPITKVAVAAAAVLLIVGSVFGNLNNIYIFGPMAKDFSAQNNVSSQAVTADAAPEAAEEALPQAPKTSLFSQPQQSTTMEDQAVTNDTGETQTAPSEEDMPQSTTVDANANETQESEMSEFLVPDSVLVYNRTFDFYIVATGDQPLPAYFDEYMQTTVERDTHILLRADKAKRDEIVEQLQGIYSDVQLWVADDTQEDVQKEGIIVIEPSEDS